MQIDGVALVASVSDTVMIETPRCRAFTRILQKIASAGGQVVVIAGNDDPMVSIIKPLVATRDALQTGELISRISRDGFDGNRLLVGVKVAKLAALLAEPEAGKRTLEHIYDY